MAPLYKPPTLPTTCQQPSLALVTRADPQWSKQKYNEIEYLMTQRAIYYNPYVNGPYSRRTNVYPVGQQYGGLDPLIQAALAPTVGNNVPGLYLGVATEGWA